MDHNSDPYIKLFSVSSYTGFTYFQKWSSF